MAQKIVPEAQAVAYDNKRYAYTDAATDTDYYVVDDAGAVDKTGNVASTLSAWLNSQGSAAAATGSSSMQAKQKSLGKTLLTIALVIVAIVAAAWAYKKFIK